MEMSKSELFQKEKKTYYSDREKVLLMSLIEKFKNDIENKKTDGTNLHKKNAAWKRLTSLYNSNDITHRTEKQLRKLWDNLKQRTRKIDSEFKKQIIETGGGPPPSDTDSKDPINDLVRSILPSIGYVVENKWDSTALLIEKNGNEKQKQEETPNVIIQTVAPIDVVLCHDEAMVIDTPNTNENMFTPQKRKLNKISTSNNKRNYIDQEAALRQQKLKESIEQQKELHKVKLEAAIAEKNYWLTKTARLPETAVNTDERAKGYF